MAPGDTTVGSRPNCIIFYNSTVLSRLWEYKKNIGDHDGAAEILNVSPVSWNHINFRGRYAFKEKSAPIDIDAMVQKIARALMESNETDGA